MKVTKWVEFSQEVEIEISGEDVVVAMMDGEEGRSPARYLMRVVNNLAVYLRQFPEQAVGELNEAQRNVIARFFQEQAERFRVQG